MECGSFNLIATGLIILDMGNGPLNLGANFLFSDLRFEILSRQLHSLPNKVGWCLGAPMDYHSLIQRRGLEQSLPHLDPCSTASPDQGSSGRHPNLSL